MLLFSAGLLLFVVHLPGSQTKPQSTPDPVLCQFVEYSKCQETAIKSQCINLCSRKTDAEFCTYISPDTCTEAYISAECPQTCQPTTKGQECSSPWFPLGGQCFLVVGESRTWSAARSYCSQQAPGGGDLAAPHNITALAEYLYKNARFDAYWLGGSDLATEGVWTWVNNGGSVTTGWTPGEPTNRGGVGDDRDADCLGMAPDWHAESMGDLVCDVSIAFVCMSQPS